MKKHLLLSLFLLLTSNLFAQYQFQYELTFKKDSTNRDFVQQELFNLDVLDGESVFYAEAYAELDSIRANGGSIGGKNAPDPLLDYYITKDLAEKRVAFHEVIGFARYAIPENREIKWAILPETKTYDSDTEEEYQLQKATTNFGGREWTAWFASEIAVQDGPYKFYGLPGLIFELYDTERDYVFSLIKIGRTDRLFSSNLFKSLGIETHPVDFEKYIELKEEFQKNPGANFRQYMKTMGVDAPASLVRDFSESTKARMAKNNNTIELTTEE